MQNHEQKAQFLSPKIVGNQVFGWSPQTSYNKIFNETFPFPLYLIGGLKMVKVSDIQQVIDSIKPVESTKIAPEKEPKKRGRPTKASQIEKIGGAK